jgi:nitroimidazol reductase NimA-like FMN-containing flavoprotein (pyridoxamine 5'-phosphate oxidase superfamily)
MKSEPIDTPAFRDLGFDEIEAMLQSHKYGRLAFAFRERVDIEPISYAYEPGWLYCRTSPGTKLTALSHQPWVAFEIDEVTGPFDWQSVVVKGTMYLSEPGEGVTGEAYERTLAALRRLMPEMLTPADPAPQRSVLFRVHIDEMHGRAASSSGE